MLPQIQGWYTSEGLPLQPFDLPPSCQASNMTATRRNPDRPLVSEDDIQHVLDFYISPDLSQSDIAFSSWLTTLIFSIRSLQLSHVSSVEQEVEQGVMSLTNTLSHPLWLGTLTAYQLGVAHFMTEFLLSLHDMHFISAPIAIVIQLTI